MGQIHWPASGGDSTGAPWKVVNLECVVSERGAAVADKRYVLACSVEAVRVLAEARINAVSLANNHAAILGQDALVDSIARLRASDIVAVGAGETQERAYAPHFFTARNGTQGGGDCVK